jgi:methyl-accepting chemotaxis protein
LKTSCLIPCAINPFCWEETAPPSRPHKRKILDLTVNRALQVRLIARVSTLVMVSLLIMAALLYQHANQEITGPFRPSPLKARTFLDFLPPVLAIAFAISLLAGIVGSFFVPRGLAGPLHRMEEELRRIAAGDLTVRITLRDGDEGAGLAAQINDAVDHFQKTAATVWVVMRQVDTLCQTAGEDAMPPLPQIRTLCARVGAEMDRFTL